jgi:hypothetical protein
LRPIRRALGRASHIRGLRRGHFSRKQPTRECNARRSNDHAHLNASVDADAEREPKPDISQARTDGPITPICDDLFLLRFPAYSTVILRCSPPFAASLEGWPHASVLAAILRDAAQARGS